MPPPAPEATTLTPLPLRIVTLDTRATTSITRRTRDLSPPSMKVLRGSSPMIVSPLSDSSPPVST